MSERVYKHNSVVESGCNQMRCGSHPATPGLVIFILTYRSGVSQAIIGKGPMHTHSGYFLLVMSSVVWHRSLIVISLDRKYH